MVTLQSLRSGTRLLYIRDLLRELVYRDLRLRYKGSWLGIGWSMVNPLAQILVFTFLFNRVLPLNIPNYTVFVFVGVLAWAWFQNGLISAAGSIVDNRVLIRRPGFPVAILPAVTVATNMIHFLLAFPILLVALVLTGGQLHLGILALPVIMLIQFLLTLGLAYIIAATHVNFRDTQHMLGVIMLLLFYLTPVFYRANAIPEQYQFIYNLNPMAHLLTAYRALLIQGDMPALGPLLVITILALGLLGLGYTYFQRASARFVEEV
ncbi:MAG: ABC transporter permease [Oscillochloridaceae bacterium umkhey_bin13]